MEAGADLRALPTAAARDYYEWVATPRRENPMPDRSTIRYTYQDYLAIPEQTPYRRHEIVDGELFVTPAPRARHQMVVVALTRILATLALEHELGEVIAGPVTVRLHDEGVVEPDVIFVRADRSGIVDPEGAVHGAPDLVVEVLSPSNERYDRGPKRKQYLRYHVPELWLVDADERTVEVWRPGAEKPEVIRDAAEWRIAGHRFEIPLEELFRG